MLPDGRVVSGSDDQTVRMWDVDAGTCCMVFGFAAFEAVASSRGLLVAGDGFGNVWFVDLPPKS